MNAPARAQDVLQFWFGARPYTSESVQPHARLWFADTAAPELVPQTDELIRERFGATLLAAERDQLSGWASSPRRRLALILLLDQFSRNAYRGTARAYARDDVALALTVSGLQIGADATLHPLERLFFYLPMMHAEATELQEESVAAFRRLQHEAPAEFASLFDRSLEYALVHRDIIARFGRFPHRNQALQRPSSAAEQAWLEGPVDRFGQ